MKHSTMLWGAVSLLFSGTAAVSALVFYSVLPNTDDDSVYEYIEIFNQGCSDVDLSWVSIRDASGKVYTFTWGALAPGQVRRIPREESKITLNNTDESLVISDSSGNQLDSIRYATSTKNIAIEWKPVLSECVIHSVEEVITEEVTELFSETGGIMETEPDFLSESSGSSISVQDDVLSWFHSGSTSLSGGVYLTGGLSLSGVLSSSDARSSSGMLTSSGMSSSSWAVFHTGISLPTEVGTLSGSILRPSEPLKAERMTLLDTDSNGRLDHVIVSYGGMLSGAINRAWLFVSSASGGLASFLIDTSSGVVREMSYSGSELHILLFEQDIIHPDLRINNTSKSHLRLKSSSVFWLTDLFGTPVTPLTLTQSFDEYDPSRIENRMVSQIITSNSGSSSSNAPSSVQVTVTYPQPSPIMQTASNPEVVSVGAQPVSLVWSGASPPLFPSSSPSILVPPQTAMSTATPSPQQIRTLPDPIIRIQSGVASSGHCLKDTCSVNVVHSVREKFEHCQWEFFPLLWTGATITGCNPRSFILGKSGGWIRLTVSDKLGLLAEKQSTVLIHPFESERAVGEDGVSREWVISQSTSSGSEQVSTFLLSGASDSVVKKGAQEVGSTRKKSSTALTGSSGNWSKASNPKAPTTKKTTKTTTKKTVAAKPSSSSKTGSDTTEKDESTKKRAIAPSSKQAEPISDSAILWIVWIACAWIGFGLSFIRKRPDEEPLD